MSFVGYGIMLLVLCLDLPSAVESGESKTAQAESTSAGTAEKAPAEAVGHSTKRLAPGPT